MATEPLRRRVPGRTTRPAGPSTGSSVLRVVAAVGLAVDAYVHADLASCYAGPAGVVGQQGLFLVEAGIAVAAALLVLTRGRPAVYLAAALVAASALAAVIASRYVDLGPIGPLAGPVRAGLVPGEGGGRGGEAVALVAAGLLPAESGPLARTGRER